MNSSHHLEDRNGLLDVLQKAVESIKSHPYGFLYDKDVQRAFRGLQREHEDVLSVSVPITALEVEKLKLLPLPTEVTDKIEFPWFPMEHDIGTVAVEFVEALVKGLNNLPENRTPTEEEVQRVKERYSPGVKVRIKRMLDDHAPKDGTVDEVSFVDDIGQIHIKSTSLALIPGVDEFERLYECSRCGKEFSYPPALSRADNGSFVCRICGAEEALEAVGASEDMMEQVLAEIRKQEVT